MPDPNQSPKRFRVSWGRFADSTQLPNLAGATVQDSNLAEGDIAYILGAPIPALYVCTTATRGAAVWAEVQAVPIGGQVQLITLAGITTWFPTIGAALAPAVAGDIVVASYGVYSESVTVPPGVSLLSDTVAPARITGAAATGTRVTLGDQSSVEGFIISMPTDAAPAIAVPAAGSGVSTIQRITFTGGVAGTSKGFSQNNATWVTLLQDIIATAVIATPGADVLIECVNGRVIATNVLIIQGTFTSVVRIGGGSVPSILLTIISTPRAGATITNLLEIGVNADVIAVDIVGQATVTNGIRVTASTADFRISCVDFVPEVTNHILVDTGINPVAGSVEGVIRRNQINADAAWLQNRNTLVVIRDDTSNETGWNCIGPFSVGAPESGKPASLGEGASYVRDMTVLQATGALVATDGSNFVDVSAEAASRTGSTFAFTTAAIGDVLYWSSAIDSGVTLQHFGLELLIDTAMVGGTIIFEVWDGAAWAEIEVMETMGAPPFTPRGNNIWTVAEATQLRYGVLTSNMLLDPNLTTPTTTWVTKTVNSIGPLFWARARVISSPGTPPVFEQSRLHTSRLEVGINGFPETFGEARQLFQLLMHQRLTDDRVGPASPGNSSIIFSANIDLALQDNGFTPNQVDGVGVVIYLPPLLDTSLPLIFRIGWIPSSTNAGNVKWDFKYRVFGIGELINVAQLETGSGTELQTAPGVADELVFHEFELDISDAVSGCGYVAVGINRDGPGDTFTGVAEVVFMQAHGFKWLD